ncbi:MAG: DUF4954 family protein [Spirochaetes bacterium]|nr:DUF4954 family protein [Spirochaetota bacterium]
MALKWDKKELFAQMSKMQDRIRNIEKKARSLSQEEIQFLKNNNNFSNNWSKIKIYGKTDLSLIRGNLFYGEVVLSVFSSRAGHSDTGIFHSTLTDCIIDEDVLIKDVSLLKNYYVGKGCALINNGTIEFVPNAKCGNNLDISLGIESGGREVRSYAEITMDEAVRIACHRQDKDLLKQYEDFVSSYLKKFIHTKGLIGEASQIVNNQQIENSYMGEGAVVNSATSIKNSSLLSNREEHTCVQSGSVICDSIVQWGCEVSSLAYVSNSILLEHSHVERHGKVIQSIIGPNSGIAEGEVNASLVGPFVGFHHQALLIAALWPEGKGNVAYGANAGSNHTAKAPDQEIWPGEGAFFGLGVNIKFPANYKDSPYSIIATGVVTLPQRIEFPFSLINTPTQIIDGLSPAYNEIMPGWVLNNNIYTIKRNEGKYKKRNKARRTKFEFNVFRKDIIDLLLNARERLEGITTKKNFYTEKEITGLGKNFLLEENREKAIKAYTFFIRYYVLKGLFRIICEFESRNRKIDHNSLFVTFKDGQWDYEKSILIKEFGKKDLKELLTLLVNMEETIAEDVKSSKQRDDKRGQKIIPDYAAVHTLAEDDSFVKQTFSELKAFKAHIRKVLEKIR